MNFLTSLLFYLANILLLPPLLIGLIRTGKARLQNRRGPSPLQVYYDLYKLMRKGETISQTAGWNFLYSPYIILAVSISVALMIPWTGTSSPIPGDLFLVIYLLALGKFASGLAALDTGSSFGAIAASREAAVSVQSEPAMILALTALAVQAHSSSLSLMLTPGHFNPTLLLMIPLALIALGLSILADLSRMPVDDPATHLELTMIHEALILEYSGRRLALIEYASALRTTFLFGLMAQVIMLLLHPFPPLLAYFLSLGLIGVCALSVVVMETTLVKLRWRRIPNLLSFAITSGALACLIVAMRG